MLGTQVEEKEDRRERERERQPETVREPEIRPVRQTGGGGNRRKAPFQSNTLEPQRNDIDSNANFSLWEDFTKILNKRCLNINQLLSRNYNKIFRLLLCISFFFLFLLGDLQRC